MRLNTIKPAEGSKRDAKRLGRGIGSGLGKTGGRGHKGQKSRSGGFHKVGFEGGQMPLQRRLPKFGFTNINRKEYMPVNVARLEELVTNGVITDGVVTPDVLFNLGVTATRRGLVKILGNGDLTTKLDITAHAFSATAKEKIEAAGGTATTI